MSMSLDGFVTFFIKTPANGFERGWYYRLTDSLHNEPIGPFEEKLSAETAAIEAINIQKKLDHSKCMYSTDLVDNITAGQGKLSIYGTWQFPCDECADEMQRRYDEHKESESCERKATSRDHTIYSSLGTAAT